MYRVKPWHYLTRGRNIFEVVLLLLEVWLIYAWIRFYLDPTRQKFDVNVGKFVDMFEVQLYTLQQLQPQHVCLCACVLVPMPMPMLQSPRCACGAHLIVRALSVCLTPGGRAVCKHGGHCWRPGPRLLCQDLSLLGHQQANVRFVAHTSLGRQRHAGLHCRVCKPPRWATPRTEEGRRMRGDTCCMVGFAPSLAGLCASWLALPSLASSPLALSLSTSTTSSPPPPPCSASRWATLATMTSPR